MSELFTQTAIIAVIAGGRHVVIDRAVRVVLLRAHFRRQPIIGVPQIRAPVNRG